MTRELLTPAAGTPPLLTTPAQFATAANQLAAGRGPFALDTERASAYRFDDRIFVLQIRRRGAGTFLFAPEGHRLELSQLLAPILNGADWVMHSALSDAPGLAMLDLRPGSLFDTELAGRLAGFSKVNLAAMIEGAFDIHLRKGHGAEDWSLTPLPQEWLDYAALDVELLLELQEYLTELLDSQHKLTFAEEEFAHLAKEMRHLQPAQRAPKFLKGYGQITNRETLAIINELWQSRELIARREDLSPSSLLSDKALLAAAEAQVSSVEEFRRLTPIRTNHLVWAKEWLQAIAVARHSPQTHWPYPLPRRSTIPPRSQWARHYPAAADALAAAQETLEEISCYWSIPLENILKPALLRAAVWSATEGHELATTADLADFLTDFGARSWQRDLVLGPLARVLFRHYTHY